MKEEVKKEKIYNNILILNYNTTHKVYEIIEKNPNKEYEEILEIDKNKAHEIYLVKRKRIRKRGY